MLKRHIVDFSKEFENSDFLKMRNNLQVEKIRMFDVFPNWNGPFDDICSSFQ